jgi:tryptophan-rich sensory protein
MINFVAATLLLLLCLGISVFFVWEASDRTITSVEGILFQVFALATGLIGSFIFGRQSARAAAREMIKPHARSAFRRLTSLYVGLSDIARVIEAARNLRSNDDQRLALAKLE